MSTNTDSMCMCACACSSAGQRVGEAQSVTGGPQQFNLTAAAAPENENMAGHGIVFQRRLYFRSQAVEAISHIGDTGNQPNFGPGR